MWFIKKVRVKYSFILLDLGSLNNYIYTVEFKKKKKKMRITYKMCLSIEFPNV